MRLRKKDYVVLSTGRKNVGARVVNDGRALLMIDPHIKKRVIDFSEADVLVNLGPKPAPGKVYGVDFTNLWKGRTEVKGLGLELNWFYSPEKEVKSNLNKAFRVAHKRLVSRKLGFLMENDNTVWEILPFSKGKYAGMYKHPRDVSVPGRLVIWPEKMGPSDYPYIILHELGHRLHLRFVEDRALNAKWLAIYNRTIQVIDIDKATSKSLLKDLLRGDIRPASFAKTLEDDEHKLAYKWILRWIHQVRSLSVHDLDTMWLAESYSEIESVWPSRAIPKRELKPAVSEYATKNVRELIAESFAFKLCGKKIPKSIDKLLELTIQEARRSYKANGDAD